MWEWPCELGYLYGNVQNRKLVGFVLHTITILSSQSWHPFGLQEGPNPQVSNKERSHLPLRSVLPLHPRPENTKKPPPLLNPSQQPNLLVLVPAQKDPMRLRR